MTYRTEVKRIGIIFAAASLSIAAPLTASAAPSTTASNALDAYRSQTLSWHECSAGECADLRVPLDYADLSKGDISLVISRVVHSGPTSQGSIVINPGGPGESGLAFAWYAAKFLAPAVAK